MKSKSESSGKSKGGGSAKQMQASDNIESSSSGSEYPREQMIAEAAYFYAERRGFTPDNDMADWFQAEAEVNGLLEGSH